MTKDLNASEQQSATDNHQCQTHTDEFWTPIRANYRRVFMNFHRTHDKPKVAPWDGWRNIGLNSKSHPTLDRLQQ